MNNIYKASDAKISCGGIEIKDFEVHTIEIKPAWYTIKYLSFLPEQHVDYSEDLVMVDAITREGIYVTLTLSRDSDTLKNFLNSDPHGESLLSLGVIK